MNTSTGRTDCRAGVRVLALIAACYTLPGAAARTAADTSWELRKQADGISVYTRPVDGSPYLAVKATVRIQAPVDRVSQLMGTGEGCAEWRTRCKSSRVIEQPSANERYVHMVLDLPWPASDRDIVMRSSASIDPATRTATILLDSASSWLPPGDLVRAESSGRFVIEAIADQTVDFTYVMHTDLGGDLPAEPVNKRMTETTFHDLERLKHLAER